MAKKGQVQLQTEVTNEDEWEKLLQKDGLILVDVYSEWCGPCVGMSANLKKIKLEVGGDMLHLATAKSDHIEALKRFRNKSEPTWMFISKRKMVNLMFGPYAPKLTRLIIAELKLESMAASGEEARYSILEITDLSQEEQVRQDAAESIIREAKAKEEAKRAKEEFDRKTAECKAILANMANTGAILIFPHAKDKYRDVMQEKMNEASIAIQTTEKVAITEELIKELMYFSDTIDSFDETTVRALVGKNVSLGLLMHGSHGEEIPRIQEVILRVVYGPMAAPPGSPDSPARLLQGTIEEEDETYEVPGIWAPHNPMVKATFQKLFFHRQTAEYVIPEPEPTPDHFAIVFELGKASNALQIALKFPEEVLKSGYFTDEVPEKAKLVAKNARLLESAADRTLVPHVQLNIVGCNGQQLKNHFLHGSLSNEQIIHLVYSRQVYDRQVKISKEILQEILYFSDYKFPNKTVEEITDNKLSLAIAVKRTSEDLPGDIDQIVLQLIYGNSRKPPGDENSPSQLLLLKVESENSTRKEEDEAEQENPENEEHEQGNDKNEEDLLLGVWAPPNNLAKAVVLKYLFPALSAPFLGPEIEITPIYVAVCYDAFKAQEVLQLSEEYPGQVMSLGFFTSDIPTEAQLIAKTLDKFEEKKAQYTYEEKVVIQLSKANVDCVMAFCELGPTYMSVDAIVGEMDCQFFFPPGYNAPEEEAKQEKKKTKKRGKKHAAAINKDASVAATETTVNTSNENEADQMEDENEEPDSDEEKPADSEETENDNSVAGTDKATSPMQDKVTDE